MDPAKLRLFIEEFNKSLDSEEEFNRFLSKAKDDVILDNLDISILKFLFNKKVALGREITRALSNKYKKEDLVHKLFREHRDPIFLDYLIYDVCMLNSKWLRVGEKHISPSIFRRVEDFWIYYLKNALPAQILTKMESRFNDYLEALKKAQNAANSIYRELVEFASSYNMCDILEKNLAIGLFGDIAHFAGYADWKFNDRTSDVDLLIVMSDELALKSVKSLESSEKYSLIEYLDSKWKEHIISYYSPFYSGIGLYIFSKKDLQRIAREEGEEAKKIKHIVLTSKPLINVNLFLKIQNEFSNLTNEKGQKIIHEIIEDFKEAQQKEISEILDKKLF